MDRPLVDVPSQEIEYPMAFVILGGLIRLALLNLFALPAFYGIVGRPSQAPDQSA